MKCKSAMWESSEEMCAWFCLCVYLKVVGGLQYRDVLCLFFLNSHLSLHAGDPSLA